MTSMIVSSTCHRIACKLTASAGPTNIELRGRSLDPSSSKSIRASMRGQILNWFSWLAVLHLAVTARTGICEEGILAVRPYGTSFLAHWIRSLATLRSGVTEVKFYVENLKAGRQAGRLQRSYRTCHRSFIHHCSTEATLIVPST